jgi:hypothetical protein
MIEYVWSVWGDICGAGVLLLGVFRFGLFIWERYTDRRGWNSTGLAVNIGREVLPGESWSIQLHQEVLVATTPTRLDTGLAYRAGLEIQNRGPNSIFCAIGDSTGLAVNIGREVLPGESWSIQLHQNVPVWGICSVLQVTGAATIVNES